MRPPRGPEKLSRTTALRQLAAEIAALPEGDPKRAGLLTHYLKLKGKRRRSLAKPKPQPDAAPTDYSGDIADDPRRLKWPWCDFTLAEIDVHRKILALDEVAGHRVNHDGTPGGEPTPAELDWARRIRAGTETWDGGGTFTLGD